MKVNSPKSEESDYSKIIALFKEVFHKYSSRLNGLPPYDPFIRKMQHPNTYPGQCWHFLGFYRYHYCYHYFSTNFTRSKSTYNNPTTRSCCGHSSDYRSFTPLGYVLDFPFHSFVTDQLSKASFLIKL